VTELPLGTRGRVFRSAMPFGPYDPEGHGIEEYRAHRVSVIVLLASDQECREKAKRDLRSLYQQGGLQVIHLRSRTSEFPRGRRWTTL